MKERIVAQLHAGPWRSQPLRPQPKRLQALSSIAEGLVEEIIDPIDLAENICFHQIYPTLVSV
jgi:hypothetical protein